MNRWTTFGWVGAFLLVLAGPGHAAIARYAGARELVKVSGLEVPIFPEARLTGTKPLYLTGKGLREKKVAFFTANVYVAASYVDSPEFAKLPKDAPLEQARAKVIASRTKMLQLNFVRDVGADKIREAFRETLKNNDIPTDNDSEAGKMLAQIQDEMKKGQQITLLGTGAPGAQTLKIELPTKMIEAKGPYIADNFWKIWFGKSHEEAINKLQLQLLGRERFPS
jgi:hypothetical protein